MRNVRAASLRSLSFPHHGRLASPLSLFLARPPPRKAIRHPPGTGSRTRPGVEDRPGAASARASSAIVGPRVRKTGRCSSSRVRVRPEERVSSFRSRADKRPADNPRRRLSGKYTRGCRDRINRV